MVLMPGTKGACRNCGGPAAPTTYEALTPAIVWRVLTGQVRYGGEEPPVVSCGECGAELEF